jgi:hypothetical protein
LLKFSLSKFAKMALWEAYGLSSKCVLLFYCLVQPIQSLSIFSLGIRLCILTCKTRQLYLGEGRWPIIVSKHAPHIDSQNAKVLQKMHVYVSFNIIKWSNNGLVVCPFQYLILWTPYLMLYAHVSLAQKKIPTQNTLWHFTPKGGYSYYCHCSYTTYDHQISNLYYLHN